MINPKILFISHDPFSIIGSNGKTFLSLFENFEDKDILQLYYERLIPHTNKFNNYYRITDLDIFNSKFTYKNIEIAGIVENTLVKEIKIQRNTRFRFNIDLLIKLIRNFLFNSVHLTEIDSFKRCIDNFKPNVIFFVGSSYIYNYRILKEISETYQLPYYIYFTDDYFIYNVGNSWISKFFHKRFVKKTKVIVEQAQELFVISPKMKKEFGEYFKKKSSILINAVDTKEPKELKIDFNTSITFRYFGWLHSNRSSSLRYLGQCLKYINDNSNYHCSLEIYSLSTLTKKSKNDLAVSSIKIMSPLMGEEFLETLNSSDFLVHAESFEPEDTQVTMLSVSTKIPEYLLSNRCIVAVGPSELASINLLQENNLAIILSEKKSMEKDAFAILKIIKNIDLYNEYCQRAIAYCKKEFNSTNMRNTLREKLSQKYE